MIHNTWKSSFFPLLRSPTHNPVYYSIRICSKSYGQKAKLFNHILNAVEEMHVWHAQFLASFTSINYSLPDSLNDKEDEAMNGGALDFDSLLRQARAGISGK